MASPQLEIDSIPEDDSTFLIRPAQVLQENQQWPFIFWIYLKSIGLYHSGKCVVRNLGSTFQI